MATFDGSISIRRPPAAVFDVVGTRLFETQSQWEDGIVAIHPVTDGPMRVGSKALMERQDLLFWRHITEYQCIVFDRDQIVVMHNDSPGTHVVFRLSIAPLQGGTTLLRFVVQVELSGFSRLLEPLAQLALRARRKTLLDIKEYVELNTT
jgi:hypothetical protein